MSDNTTNNTTEENTNSSSSSIFSAIKKELFYIAVAAIIAIVGVIMYNRYTTNQYKELIAKLDSEKAEIVRELDIIDQNVRESKEKLNDINKNSNETVVTLIQELNEARKGVTTIEIESDEEVKKYLDALASMPVNSESNIGR